jgi:ABC-type antimicrobial peptide transport system permease subunit
MMNQKIYLRQAWTLMKQNRLYSAIYIVGTGLSVALMMVVFLIYYIKFAPIYPEYNRNKTLVMKGISVEMKDGMTANSLSYHIGHDIIPNMKYVKDVAMVHSGSDYINDKLIVMPRGKENITVAPLYVNDGFWRVFTFDFISGRPFTAADERAQRNKAVISESLAKKVFGSADAAGRYLENNGRRYEVAGVVKDVSAATPATYADIWMVIPKSEGAESDNVSIYANGLDVGKLKIMGSYYCYMTVREDGEQALLKNEITQYVRKLSLLHRRDSVSFNLEGQPDTYAENSIRTFNNTPIDYRAKMTDFLVMMFALLFVPALNLCGMISSRMDGRMSEMGIRKAFGARRKTLLGQILSENMVLTATGALLGLLMSYLILAAASDWILQIFDTFGKDNHVDITLEMLFNPVIIGIAVAVCFVLNLASAVLPAVLSLRHDIISSINTKR